jgi:hypothetical protein
MSLVLTNKCRQLLFYIQVYAHSFDHYGQFLRIKLQTAEKIVDKHHQIDILDISSKCNKRITFKLSGIRASSLFSTLVFYRECPKDTFI